MGYCTEYELTVHNGSFPEILDEIERTTGWGNPFCGESMKWYSHPEDMLAVSRQFPDALLILDGVGEEYPDIWRYYFKNGKSVKIHAEIVHAKFTEDMLK